MSVFDKINQLIETSDLSPEDKTTLSGVFAALPTENLPDVAELLEANPQLIPVFNENYKDKVRALEDLDREKWQYILKKQEDLLVQMVGGE